MSTSSSESPNTPANPYKAPVSAASSFTKSYLTLAIGGGLVAATLLTGLWLYARSESPADARDPSEREIFMERRALPKPPHGTDPFDVNSREVPTTREAPSLPSDDPFGAGEDNSFGVSDPFGDAPADPLDDSPFGGATTYDPFEATKAPTNTATPLAEREDPFGS